MADMINFCPDAGASSQVLAVTASASTAISVGSDGYAGGELLVSNQGTTVWCFIAFGTTATIAQNNAVIATAGNPAGGIAIPPGWSVAFTLGPGTTFVSAIGSAAGPTNLHMTVGRAAA